MDFSKLRAFIVVAEELNFRRSAEILGMSQPPLTRLIASLEKELGTKLFERTTRSVRLTGPGVLLLKEAREIADAMGRIERDVRIAGKMKTGSIRIGFSRTAFMVRFPTMVEEFQNRFPKMKLDLHELPSGEIIKRLKNGQIDFGFSEQFSSDHGLRDHEIGSENLGVLLPLKHPLAKKKEIQFDDLKNETIILHHRREAEDFHDRVSKLIGGMKQKPKIYIKGETESCPILVATGKGVSLTISGSQNIAPEHTRFVPIRDMFLPVHVIWRDESLSPQLNTFLSFVMEKKSVLSRDTQCLVLTPTA